MTLKKTLVTVGAVAAVTIGSTGVATAQDTETPDSTGSASSSDSEGSGSRSEDTPDSSTPTAGSAELSANRDVFGSITDADALGSYNGEQISYERSLVALASLAGGAASVAAIAGAYNAVIDASDAYQGVVNDTLGFLAQQGITLPN